MKVRNIFFCAVLFVATEICLFYFVDRPVSECVRQLDVNHPALINFFRAYTDLGKSKWYLWPSGTIIVLCAILHRTTLVSQQIRQRYYKIECGLLFFFLSIAGSGVATDAIKPLLGRARPVELLRDGLYGFYPLSPDARWESMPSGHATSAFALATALIILLPRGRLLWLASALILAVSRVMVNAHYLSDVIAGAAMGIGVTMLMARALNLNRINPLIRWLFPIDGRVKSH